MLVALVSSVLECGVAEHSDMLKTAVRTADSSIEFVTDGAWLDPQQFSGTFPDGRGFDAVRGGLTHTRFDAALEHAGYQGHQHGLPVLRGDLVHLNYHRGLHSRWTPEVIASYGPTPFVITFHDTFETQPDDLAFRLLDTFNVRGMVVHEPCDLVSHPKVHYWRQPCPPPLGRGWPADIPKVFTAHGWRPTLGTLGWDFPWKNYDLLADVTAERGWNLRIVGKVDGDRRKALAARNPNIWFDGYVETPDAIAKLSACDATAFLYTCANSGTSGAIRQGITAGKPLIAATGCRQFRDLEGTAEGWPIRWIAPNADALAMTLDTGEYGYSFALIGLAQDLSWEKVGPQYAKLYRDAVADAARNARRLP
jgi:glycosyltransferase involved in cell wall biosynthesis